MAITSFGARGPLRDHPTRMPPRLSQERAARRRRRRRRPVELFGEFARDHLPALRAQPTTNEARSAGERASARQKEHATWTIAPGPPRPAGDHCRQALLHLVEIVGRVLVDDDDVGDQALDPPVLLRLQDVTNQPEIVTFFDRHEQDRQVSGDTVRPQRRLALRECGKLLRRGPQRLVQVQHTACQSVVLAGEFARDAEVPQAASGCA